MDITLEEVKLAMGWLQGGKVPEADGFPPMFYNNLMELFASKLNSLLSDFVALESLPDSMNEAIIVLVPKPSKGPQDCASY